MINHDIVEIIIDKANVKDILFQYEYFKFTTSEQYARQYFSDIWSENACYLETMHGFTYEVMEDYEDIVVPQVVDKIDAYLKENGTDVEMPGA